MDTVPRSPADPEFPYVGKFITDLTLEQVKTVQCGYQALPDFPSQEVVTGPMVELVDVFDLVERYDAKQLTLNIETKVEAGAPQQTAPRDVFVAKGVGGDPRRRHEQAGDDPVVRLGRPMAMHRWRRSCLWLR